MRREGIEPPAALANQPTPCDLATACICETIFNDVLQSSEMSTLQRERKKLYWVKTTTFISNINSSTAAQLWSLASRPLRNEGVLGVLTAMEASSRVAQLQDTTLEGLACNEVACHPAPGMGERRERPEYVVARVNRVAMDFGLIATASLLLGFKVGDVGDIQRGMWPDCQAMDLSDFIVHLSSFSRVLSGDGLYFPLDLIASFALLAVASFELLTVVYHVPLCPIHASFCLY
ncbi:hypothetical protein B0H16DRAFT_1691040 [Mycena metata]|uniref:Uncharacterized protein n=1 Tax=Mycena metata TaxID=1033252 RepID=A0AAD7IXN2_9AGAR|nr:hypothetical protein B0H16DRAFT_1691040 [Mycena metata]